MTTLQGQVPKWDCADGTPEEDHDWKYAGRAGGVVVMNYTTIDTSKQASTTFTFRAPVYVGHWTIGGNWHVHVTKRPRWLTRVMMKWLLEWEWEELKVSAQEDE